MNLVKKLSKRKCFTINENETIAELISVLLANNIGALVVVNTKKSIVGIVSERDVVRYLKDLDNKTNISKVKSIMTENPITCDLSSSSNDLMKLMNDNKIRHLPIVNNGKLSGIVSIGDVVNRVIEKYKEETSLLRNFIQS